MIFCEVEQANFPDTDFETDEVGRLVHMGENPHFAADDGGGNGPPNPLGPPNPPAPP